MNLPDIQTNKKSGKEKFIHNKNEIDFSIIDFWKWSQSDLVENRTRGILAEFIVKQALSIISEIRTEWDNYDLITKDGVKIEIKSAAYIQTWKQKKYSNISFSISKKFGYLDDDEKETTIKRWSDYYIFCLLECKEQVRINPLDLNQWRFFVISTKTLNEKVPNQKTIGLKSLLKLSPIECKYNQLKSVMKK